MADWSLAIATRNDEPTLHDIMQKLVASLSREERAELESTWRNLRIEERVDYTLFWQILIAGLLVTALLVYWNRKLGRLNRKLADADHFKKINDNWGHDAGDRCLEALASTMREHFRRDTDRLARFGGEEFVIFTSYEDASDIQQRLDDFRAAVATQRCDTCQEKGIELTVSIGLALGVPSPDHSSAEYLRLADQALYAAKRNGRNRLELTTASPSAAKDRRG